MLAEKELQGRRQRMTSTFTPRMTSGQTKTAPNSQFCAAAPSIGGGRSTAPSPPSSTLEGSKTSILQAPAKSSSSVASTGRTTGIKCHCCQAIGHIMKDFPSQRAYIVTED